MVCLHHAGRPRVVCCRAVLSPAHKAVVTAAHPCGTLVSPRVKPDACLPPDVRSWPAARTCVHGRAGHQRQRTGRAGAAQARGAGHARSARRRDAGTRHPLPRRPRLRLECGPRALVATPTAAYGRGTRALPFVWHLAITRSFSTTRLSQGLSSVNKDGLGAGRAGVILMTHPACAAPGGLPRAARLPAALQLYHGARPGPAQSCPWRDHDVQ